MHPRKFDRYTADATFQDKMKTKRGKRVRDMEAHNDLWLRVRAHDVSSFTDSTTKRINGIWNGKHKKLTKSFRSRRITIKTSPVSD